MFYFIFVLNNNRKPYFQFVYFLNEKNKGINEHKKKLKYEWLKNRIR